MEESHGLTGEVDVEFSFSEDRGYELMLLGGFLGAFHVLTPDHLSALSTCGLPLVDGLLAFTEQEFFESAQIMNKLHPILHRMGGSAVIRDIMVLTLIESLLREGMLTEARLMLSHRTAIAPHEAQSWKRLSHVFHHLGHDELAEVAHYTSWQLGIGQGGFGGPK